MKFLSLICLILQFSVQICAAQLERLEAVECKSNEFYYAPRDACKSCSDLRILFYGGYQEEWLNSDAIKLSKPTNNGATDKQQTSNERTKEVESLRFNPPSKDVMSRLIGVDELQEGVHRYSMGQELGAGLTATDDEEQSSSVNGGEVPNPLRLDTLAVENFVDRFIASQLVRDELLVSIEQCKYFQNSSACQLWSNLCVMTLYSHSSNLASLTRAKSGNLHKGTSSDRPIRRDEKASMNGADGQWWQLCGHEFNRYTICDSLRSWWQFGGSSISREISNIFPSSNEEGLSIKIAGSNPSLKLNQPIQLLAYKYSLLGKFIGVDQFGLEQLERFCPLRYGKSTRLSQPDNNFIRLGRNMKANCRFNNLHAQALAASANETVFMDLYLAHQLNGAVFIKPVPVVIRNVLYNGILINQHIHTDPSRLKVVHRFFMNSVVELADSEQILVYSKSASLELSFKAHERSAQLISMVLVLEQRQMLITNNAEQNHNNSTSPIINHLLEFKDIDISIAQTLVDMVRYKMDFELALTILSIVSCIWSLLKSYNILRYHGMVKMDIYFLIRFLFVSCDTLANLIAACTLLFTGFLFLVFKLQQNTVHVLAPENNLDESILVNMKLALLFKTIGLSYKMYDLLNIDVFFIDWERPKMLTSAEIQNHLSYYSHQEANSQDFTGHKETLDSILTGERHKELSFWRPYAVVDRWLQLQTMRRQNLALQLILFTCFTELLGFTNLAKTEPEWSLGLRQTQDKEPEHLSATVSSSYRLFILGSVYLLLALAQIVWQKYFYEIMIRDRVREFIDLCSIGNVSLFCMLYPRFGYYVHGRNANGSGDCSISEMNGLLEREERGLCSRRGLVPDTDEQVFILILPRLINDHYRKLLCQYQHQHHPLKVNDKSDVFDRDLFDRNFFRSALNMSGWGTQMTSSRLNRAMVESIVTRKRVINVFLTNFLEHHYKDIDYSIREPRRFETFLSEPELELEMVSGRNGAGSTPNLIIGESIVSTKSTPATLYKDRTNSFTSVLWMGLEWDLILVELLCLLIIDHWIRHSLFVSVIIQYSLHWLLKMFYQVMAKNNVTFKALIDHKFLLRA